MPSPSLSQRARDQRVRLLVDAEYTSLNPALTRLVDALALRWNHAGEAGPWVWNTYQAYLKVPKETGVEWGAGAGLHLTSPQLPGRTRLNACSRPQRRQSRQA